MAPVTATSTGLARQDIDDEELVQLIESISTCGRIQPEPNSIGSSSKKYIDIDIDKLVEVLDKCQTWRFQEQVSTIELLLKIQN